MPATSVSALPENVPVTPIKLIVTEHVSVLLLLIVHVVEMTPLVCALAGGIGGASDATAKIVARDAIKGRSDCILICVLEFN